MWQTLKRWLGRPETARASSRGHAPLRLERLESRETPTVTYSANEFFINARDTALGGPILEISDGTRLWPMSPVGQDVQLIGRTFRVGDLRGIARTIQLTGSGERGFPATVDNNSSDPLTWEITGNGSGTLGPIVTFTGISYLWGSEFSGGDRFVIHPAGFVPGNISGGTQMRSTLDYSYWTTSVSVDMNNGTASGVGQWAFDISIVVGGSGNDTLIGNDQANIFVGNDGADVLRGGDGRDILIGGAGGDILDGGIDDDLLIAGSTIHDFAPNGLHQIQTEWLRTDRTFAQRCDALSNGLLQSAVYGDLSSDRLTGGAGSDWVWVDPVRTVNGKLIRDYYYSLADYPERITQLR